MHHKLHSSPLLVYLFVHQTAPKRACYDRKAILSLMHLIEEKVVPIRKSRLPTSHFADDRVLSGAENALGIGIRQTPVVSAFRSLPLNHTLTETDLW